MIRILHLTDFHLNTKTLKDWNDFLKVPFLKKITEINNVQNIDLVLFTGDMIDKAGKDFGSVSDALYSFKENVISPILIELNLDISRFIICPGNHDINRNADKPFHESGLKHDLDSIDKINSFTNLNEDDYDGIQRMKEYKDFEFKLYEGIEEKLHSKFKFSTKLNIKGKSIGISSLNSSWRCYSDDDFNNLLVGENQINDNYKFINDCDIKIALMHHQLDWISEVESKTIKSHMSQNYNLIFSGHVHQTDVEFVQNLTGTSLRIVSPSGLNQIRKTESNYRNGFSVIDYGENAKCHFFKYIHDHKNFVDNTDVCDKGVWEIIVNSPMVLNEAINMQSVEDDFYDFLNDSGANFTHRSKTLTLNDIYVAPFMEQFSLNDDDEKGSGAFKSEDILNRITNKDVNHTIILGEENSGKTSFCKKIYSNTVAVNNTVPIFVKGGDIKKITKEDIFKLINKEFRKQYKVDIDLTTKNLVVIIDDLNNCKLPQKSKKNFILNLYSFNFQTVITWDEYFTLSELLESQVTTVEVFEILKFSGKKRLELIRKWIDLLEDEFEDEQSKEFEIKELAKIVNTVIGKNLIPSLPIYILTILQANELSTATNFEQSTFGHYYDVLIKSALGQKIKANAEIEKYYSYLTELSFFLYNNKTIEIDENNFIEFHQFFIKKYSIQLSFREVTETLENCNLIQKNGTLYKFKYKYIYFYFIGKYFSDNLEDEIIKGKVTELSNRLYQTESANIYIFLSHHSKSKFIVKQILERARELFKEENIIEFNDDIKEVNSLIDKKVVDIVFEGKVETVDSDEHNLEIKIQEDNEYDINDEIDSISQVNKAFKTIEILGYIIKNRYASLTGTDKSDLVEELYKLGLRSLTFLFKTLLDGEEYIKSEIIDLIKKDPNGSLTVREREELAKQLMFNLLYMVSYSIFKRISSSIASKDLEITFNEVRTKLAVSEGEKKNNAISLIDIAVIFEYSKTFPEKDVKRLAEDLKNNPLAFHILRRLGVNFMRMIPMKEQDQQRASTLLDISMKSQRLIGGTSSIRK
ncbi:metallophosphoesterase [Flavobacterium ajazii]|uniref:metallophosphoesterase n=1 Tax=Flavobacterium ajazii TaxID=2692318 RepID=UPI0013D3070C|nr:metallophosphoesterase [Flavobacterium ajazii]